MDNDDDNDGIPDILDDSPFDHDNDGIADVEDDDDDGDGINDDEEVRDGNDLTNIYDHDNDGISDNVDMDIDNDGIDNRNDFYDNGSSAMRDHDNDGLNDGIDTDDDNDNILDVDEVGGAWSSYRYDTTTMGFGVLTIWPATKTGLPIGLNRMTAKMPLVHLTPITTVWTTPLIWMMMATAILVP